MALKLSCCNNTKNMRKIIKKFILIWASLLSLTGIYRKKENSVDDAIRLPDTSSKMIVEDYEIAAYHNQA